MKKLFRFIMSPTALIAVLFILEVGVFAWFILWFGTYFLSAYLVLVLGSLVLGIILFDKAPATNPTYKVMWLWMFVLLPLMGELMYFIWGRPGLMRRKEAKYQMLEAQAAAAKVYDDRLYEELDSMDKGLACEARYLAFGAHSPLYDHTLTRYFGHGEELYPVLLEELKKAQKSIWLEYFIYNDDSVSWKTILAVLKEKAAAGIDVRIIYDSFGCILSLPPYYSQTMQKCGIKCYEYNFLRFTLHLSDYGFLNHRDHRKLCIIDGCVGFTGGVNMADEYFGMAQPYGLWKDASIMLKGPAVSSFCATFLKMWGIVSGRPVDFESCRPPLAQETPDDVLVQPFDDSPLDTEPVSQNAYANVLHHAHRYVWLTTPYLIPDYSLIELLCLTAKSGVEVRIITPGIPDKKQVFCVTRSYYRQLLENGVHIYEYVPGFIHSKMTLSDDKIAIVGSANLDFRSLYLHFENCCACYGGEVIADIRHDFENTLASCREITFKDTEFPFWMRAKQTALRFFAPLL